MNHIIQMKSTHKTPYDAIDLKKIGKQIIMDTKGKKVMKVITVTEDNKTDQSFAEMLEINNVLAPALRKGLLRNAIKFEGEYDDYPDIDFQTAQFALAKGKTMFEQLPSKMREKFDNNTAKFLEFVNNPANAGEMIKLGMIKGADGFDINGQPIPEGTKAAADAIKTAEKTTETTE